MPENEEVQEAIEKAEIDVIRAEGPTGQESFSRRLPTEEALSNWSYNTGSGSLCWTNIMVYSPMKVGGDFQRDIEQPKWVNADNEKAINARNKLIGEYHILGTNESIDIEHNHNWGEGGGVTGAISSVANAFSKVSSTLTGNLPRSQGMKIHKLAAYQDTDLLEVTIPVTLFTLNNPIRDVIQPIMELTYLSYPIELGKVDKEKVLEEAKKSAKKNKDDEKGLIQEFSDTISAMYDFTRYAVPHYFAVSFSNRTLRIPSAVITNLSVSYKSPWARKFADAMKQQIDRGKQRGEKAVQTGMSSLEDASDSIFSSKSTAELYKNIATSTMQTIENLNKAANEPIYNDAGYPMFAEVELTFKALQPKFAQDFWKDEEIVKVGSKGDQ